MTTSPGFRCLPHVRRYRLDGLPCSTEFGGQGLPTVVSTAVNEMWKSANMAFALCPMLTGGAIEAIAHHASDDLKQKYLPKMVDGRWTGDHEPDRTVGRFRSRGDTDARRFGG